LIFLRYTGCRPGEAAKATWSDFHPKRACIELREHKTAKKTGDVRRIMLHPVVLKLLDWISRHDPDPTYIFVNTWRRPWDRGAIAYRVKQIRENAGLRADATLYGLRHLFLTQAVLNGVDIGRVMGLAGHKRIGTTQHYLHVRTEHLRSAINDVFRKDKDGEKGSQP
jgi:integrase